MKKLNLNLLIVLATGIFLTFTTSCGDENGVCQPEDYVGTFIGKYAILIPLPNPDTVVLTNLGNGKIKLKSSLLRTTFEADYDAATGECNVENINIDTLNVGTEYFANILVKSANIRLDANCGNGNLYINLNQASVDTGTIDVSVIPGVDGYPLNNVNLSTSGNGLKRQ